MSTRSKRPSFYRRLPVWAQWVLPFGVAAILIVALIVWVHHETNDVPSEAGVTSKTAVLEQDQQDATLMKQMQAPRVAHAATGVAPADALKDAITTWLKHQIKIGTYNGPLTHAACAATAGSTRARASFKCEMVTANVTYDFYGVVIPATGSVTYCQKITPYVYGMKGYPLAKSCV